MLLERPFFSQNATQVARDLLGTLLIHRTPEGVTAGVIVETEAYHQDDPASHTFSGKSARNAVMFGESGHAYIYFIYGMYFCFNISTGAEGTGEGVLIRALQPIEGIALMKQRRKIEKELQLCNGPAKLVLAMGITPAMRGVDITKGNLTVESEPQFAVDPKNIVMTPRVGITKAADALLRFYVKDNPYISKK